nr:hypothetical protein [Vicinamibacterales bacterium]
MRVLIRLLLATAVLALAAPEARADLTAFAGFGTSPTVRPSVGVSGGLTLVIVGWEFEYARTSDELGDDGEVAPAVRTYMGSVFVQNPVPIGGLTFYALAGAGVYREIYGIDTSDEDAITGFATTVGGGVKIELTG